MKNNKKADTRAVNILIAIFIIGLVVAVFYAYLVSITVTRQTNAITGNIGTLELDQDFSEWVSEQPSDLYQSLPDQLGIKFETWFKKKGYTVYSELGNNFQEGPPICKKAADFEFSCDFVLEKGRGLTDLRKYERTIILPLDKGLLKIRFTGEYNNE